MPNKIKIVLSLVAIVAVFLVYGLAKYVHTIANNDSTFQQASPLPSPNDDPDHDGLSNQQEVIWGSDPFNPDSDSDGFKDGEEVKSGHNPLVPGPDDLISQENLTQEFSDLTVSGIYSGDLKPDSQNYDQALADITAAVADSGKYVFSQKPVTIDLDVISGGTKNDLTYLKNLSPNLDEFEMLLKNQYESLISNLNTIGEKGFSDSTIKNFYTDQAKAQEDLFQQVLKMSVPKEFKDAHLHFLSIIERTGDISAAISNGEADPVKASVGLSALVDMYQNYEILLSEYRDVIKAKGLENIIKQ